MQIHSPQFGHVLLGRENDGSQHASISRGLPARMGRVLNASGDRKSLLFIPKSEVLVDNARQAR